MGHRKQGGTVHDEANTSVADIQLVHSVRDLRLLHYADTRAVVLQVDLVALPGTLASKTIR